MVFPALSLKQAGNSQMKALLLISSGVFCAFSIWFVASAVLQPLKVGDHGDPSWGIPSFGRMTISQQSHFLTMANGCCLEIQPATTSTSGISGILPLGLSPINRPEVVSHLRARSVSYRF